MANTLTAAVRTLKRVDPGLPDRDLLDRHAAGDSDAFAALVRRHGKTVLAACRQVLTDPADMDDAFQAAFVVLLKKAKTKAVVWHPNLGSWLYAVAHRIAVHARGNQTRRTIREAEASRRKAAASPDLSWRDAVVVLHEELNRLPERYRRVLLLCYLGGQSRDEAAANLGIQPGAVKGCLERGRALLAARLTRRGVALSAGLLAVLTGSSKAAAGGPSAALIDLTVRAAEGTTSSAVAALVNGATPMTFGATLGTKKALASVLLVAGMIGVGWGLGSHPPAATADDKPAQEMKKPKPEAKQPEAKGRTIIGTVQGHDDRPIQAELVFVPKDGEPKVLGRADAKGEFSVRLPEKVDGTLLAVADGHGVDGASVWSKMPTELTFLLPKAFVVRGRVLDLQGKPVAGATVTPLRATKARAERVDEFLTTWAKMSPQEDAFGQSRGDFKLGTHPRFTLRSKRMLSATTDADGQFELTGLGAEQVAELLVSGPGVADTPLLVVTRAGFDPDPTNRAAMKARATYMLAEPGPLSAPARLHGPEVAVAAEPEKLIRGVVADAATGEPRAGVPVTFGRLAEKGFLLPRPHTAVTDTDGRFVLGGSRRYESYLVETAADPKGGYLAAKAEAKDTAGLEPVEVKLRTPRADEPTRKANAEPTTLRGTVTGPDGKPVDGAKVWLVKSSSALSPKMPPKHVATTDKDGKFTIDRKQSEEPLTWGVIAATKDGFGPGIARAVTDPDDKAALRCSLALVPDDVPITGRILDLQGKPVTGATVRPVALHRTDAANLDEWEKAARRSTKDAAGGFHTFFPHSVRLKDGPFGDIREVKTDKDGKFTLTGLGRDRMVTLRVSGPGLATVEFDAVTRRGFGVIRTPADKLESQYSPKTYYGAKFDFTVEPSQPFTGVVTDQETGKPVPNVVVKSARGWDDSLQAVTDSDGKYRLDGLRTGEQELVAIPPLDQPYHLRRFTAGKPANDQPVTANVELHRGVWVNGTVTDKATGKPVEASVSYRPDDVVADFIPGYFPRGFDDATWYTTDKNGKFRVLAVPGKGFVFVRAYREYLTADQVDWQGGLTKTDPRPYVDSAPVEIASNWNAVGLVTAAEKGAKEYAFTVESGVTLKARVTDPDGKPLAGCTVTQRKNHGPFEAEKMATADVEFERVNPKRPRPVLVLHPDRHLGTLFQTKADGEATTEIRLKPTGTVRGRLLSDDGNPLPNTPVEVRYTHDADSSGWRVTSLFPQVTTDADGKFTVPNLIDGVKYELRWPRPAAKKANGYHGFTVTSGEEKNLGDVGRKTGED